MGVLDFLAQAGNRTAVGNVAQALGGKTQGQTTRDDWIDNQIPAIANRINQATTHEEIVKGMQDFVAGGLKAGIDPERLNKLTDSLVGPATPNLGANEIGKITQSLQPQTEPITPMVAPEGQGQPLDLGTMFTPQTTPGRKPTEADIFKLAEIEGRTGVKPPANMAAMLQAPSAIASHEASTRKTQQELEANQAKEAAYGDLPTTEIPGTGVNVRTAGRLGALGGFITNTMPQRTPADATLDLKRQGLEIQGQRLQVLADRVASGSATAAERAELAKEKLAFDKQKFEDAKTSQTVADVPYSSIDREVDMAAIAKEAAAQGITDPEGIRALARKRGVNLEGTPTVSGRPSGITNPYNIFSPPPTLGGDVQLSKQPKVTTRTRGAPSGGQPASQAGAPAAPKVGTVVRGYRFKGGDPSQQANWEQVR